MKKKIASNMIVSVICKPISMLIGYIYVHIVINYLGEEGYGVWSTILTILSWIGYFDIGIGNGLRNKLTESLSKKDKESRRLVSSAYAFITVIMLGVAILFITIATFLDWERIFGVKNVTENLSRVIYISLTIITINFILSICKNVLYALQQAAYVSIMELAVQILNLGGVLCAQKFFDGKILIMPIIYGFSMIFVNLITSIVLYAKKINVRPGIYYVNLRVGKSLTNLGIHFFIIQMCALILFTSDSILISCLYGAVKVTPYSIVNKLFSTVVGIFVALLAPIWSAVTMAKVEGRFNELKKAIKKLYIMTVPFVICTVILMSYFRFISRIWLGKDLDYTRELILFGGIYCCLNIWTNIQGTIANGLGLLQEQVVMAVIQAVVNIPLSIYFAEYKNMGSAGVLLGTNICMLISCIYLPACITKCIKSEEKKFGTRAVGK